MASVKIKRGMDIRLTGAPAPEITEAANARTATFYPGEFPGIKPKAAVKEGDTVKRGSVLFIDKKNEAFRFRSPAGGTVRSVVLGARRALVAIVVDVAADETREGFTRYTPAQVPGLAREDILAHLQDTGLLALLRQRPFSRMADPAAQPKAIFVNAMATAPFLPDFSVVVRGEEAAFQMGLALLGRLTTGKVHLCTGAEVPKAVAKAEGVEKHTFTGPHPAGNSSTHIHHIAPIRPGDTVWTVRATDLIQIGKLFLNGEIPSTKVVSLGGPGVRPEACRHYRVRIGGDLSRILADQLLEGEQRVVSGDLLSGTAVDADSGVRFLSSGFTVLPEGRERHFLGWLAPGMNRFSHSRLFLSRWFRRGATWSLNTNENGGHRAMVLTGLYDRFLPMQIRTDYLVRAVLAHDTTESVQLGLLETDPEDFALCAFACPSKMDLVGIMRQGLEEVEEEGL